MVNQTSLIERLEHFCECDVAHKCLALAREVLATGIKDGRTLKLAARAAFVGGDLRMVFDAVTRHREHYGETLWALNSVSAGIANLAPAESTDVLTGLAEDVVARNPAEACDAAFCLFRVGHYDAAFNLAAPFLKDLFAWPPAQLFDFAAMAQRANERAQRTRLEAAALSMLPAEHKPAASTLLRNPSTPGLSAQNPSFAVAVFTNVSDKFDANRDIAPPSTALMDITLNSAREKLAIPDDTPVYINFDTRGTQVDEDYLTNLKSFCATTGARLHAANFGGLRPSLLAMMGRVVEDYVLVLEHDWIFSDVPPALKIIAAMNRSMPLNRVRFNKRRNIETRSDHPLMALEGDGFECLATPSFSNNPHIVRRAFFERVMRPNLEQTSLLDGFNQGGGGTEELPQMMARDLMARYGHIRSLEYFGNAILGTWNANPRVQHIGI